MSYLDGFFITDSPDNPHTDVIDLGEIWLVHTDVLQNLDHTLPHTDTTVLLRNGNRKFPDDILDWKARGELLLLWRALLYFEISTQDPGCILTRILSAIMS